MKTLHVYQLSRQFFLCCLGTADYFASSKDQVERIALSFHCNRIAWEGAFLP